MSTTVIVDLNARTPEGGLYARLANVRGPLAVGVRVELEEPESGIVGWATVSRIDARRKVVDFDVDWETFRPLAERTAARIPMLEPLTNSILDDDGVAVVVPMASINRVGSIPSTIITRTDDDHAAQEEVIALWA